jgi:hypothetical protein
MLPLVQVVGVPNQVLESVDKGTREENPLFQPLHLRVIEIFT